MSLSALKNTFAIGNDNISIKNEYGLSTLGLILEQEGTDDIIDNLKYNKKRLSSDLKMFIACIMENEGKDVADEILANFVNVLEDEKVDNAVKKVKFEINNLWDVINKFGKDGKYAELEADRYSKKNVSVMKALFSTLQGGKALRTGNPNTLSSIIKDILKAMKMLVMYVVDVVKILIKEDQKVSRITGLCETLNTKMRAVDEALDDELVATLNKSGNDITDADKKIFQRYISTVQDLVISGTSLLTLMVTNSILMSGILPVFVSLAVVFLAWMINTKVMIHWKAGMGGALSLGINALNNSIKDVQNKLIDAGKTDSVRFIISKPIQKFIQAFDALDNSIRFADDYKSDKYLSLKESELIL